MATRDLDRLAKFVKARRMDLFASRKAAADSAGISKDTWQRVEESQPTRDSTYVKIDRALQWASGSCLAVSEGGEPVVADYSDDGTAVALRPPVAWAGPSAEEVVRKAVADSALVAAPGLPIGDLQALTEGIVDTLRKEGVLPEEE